MAFVQSADERYAEAFVEWINSFDHLPYTCEHISQLSDGVLLRDILLDIDPKWFRSMHSVDMGDNWVFKVNNLKKMYKLISRYYEEVFSQGLQTLPAVNLTAIAKETDTKEILKLCQRILYLAIQSTKTEKYINKIQRLSQPSQHALMVSIEQMMAQLRESDVADMQLDVNSSNGTISRSMFAADAIESPERRVSRIQQETRELDLAHQQLIKQHEELKQRYDDLELEKEELHIHLREIDHAIQLANEAGKADFAMRTEIDRIRQDLQHSEDRRQEIESILENQLETIHHLTQKTESLAEQAEYAERLKDQLDEVHHAAEKLQKAEGTIDKYRKKLQETTELRRHIKALEEQNGSLVDRNHHIEEEYRKVFVFKTLMDSYKDQVTSLEAKNSELIRETQFVEYQSQQLHQKLETLEEDRTRDADRIQSLEDHLEDLRGTRHTHKNNGIKKLTDDDEKDTMSEDEEDDQCYDEATQFEHTVKEKNTMASLKDQIRSLQKNNLSKGQERITALHQLLQETNLQKTEFEKHYLDAAQERDILQSLMMRVRAGIPEALLDRSEATKPDRDRIDALQLELKTLRETVHEMQTNPPSTLLQKNDTDALKYLEELKQKINGLEEQSKHQLQDINKLLLEKDWLYSQNMERKDLLLEKECFNSEMRASLAAMNAKDDMALRQQNTQLQQTTKELEQHMEELNIKLRKAKEFIKQQDRMLKDIKFGQHSTSHKMSAASLQAAIKQREEENDRLKMQLRESRVQARREQQLLLCAWQDVARRAHRTLIHSRLYPSAWFGAQSRKRPDSYPKR